MSTPSPGARPERTTIPENGADRFCLSWRIRRSATEVVTLARAEVAAAYEAGRYAHRVGTRTPSARRFYKHRAHAEAELARLQRQHGDRLAACITHVHARPSAAQLDFQDAGLALPLQMRPPVAPASNDPHGTGDKR